MKLVLPGKYTYKSCNLPPIEHRSHSLGQIPAHVLVEWENGPLPLSNSIEISGTGRRKVTQDTDFTEVYNRAW